MSLIASDNGGRYNGPVGMVQAVCAFVNDIGIQKSDFNGKEITAQKVIVSWELSKKMDDGRPYMVSKFYTLSLNEKANLRKDLESWRGKQFTQEELKGFDIEKLIGVNCMLNIIVTDKGRSKVATVTGLPESLPHITITNKQMSEKFQAWIDKLRFEAITEDHHEEVQQPANDGLDLPF